MPVDVGGQPLRSDAHRVAVVAALGLERASLARHAHAAQLAVHQSGPGPERAARAAAAAVAQGAVALVSWGFAGGLDPALPTGSVVVARAVRATDGAVFAVDDAWRSALANVARRAAPVSDGVIVSVPIALLTPADKNVAAAAHAAVAADMESAAIAAVAARTGVRFAAVRVIVDAHGDSLPPNAEQWIDERGNRRFGSAVGAAFRPAEWPALWTLANRYRVARSALDRLAALLAEQRFCAAEVGP